eukprot:3610923-Rhodomonas_salina.3
MEQEEERRNVIVFAAPWSLPMKIPRPRVASAVFSLSLPVLEPQPRSLRTAQTEPVERGERHPPEDRNLYCPPLLLCEPVCREQPVVAGGGLSTATCSGALTSSAPSRTCWSPSAEMLTGISTLTRDAEDA